MAFAKWLALALVIASSAAFGEEDESAPRIYRWIDENGIAHYTTSLEQVPEELRDQPLQREQVSAQAPAGVDAWVVRERVAEPPKPGASSLAPGAGDSAPAENDRLAALNARISELERAIAADEELLKGDLTGSGAPTSNDELKEVAERMPARLEELKKLQAERDALAAPNPG